MSELMSVLDGLAADDLVEFSGREVLDRTTMLVMARNRIDAELARTVRRADVTDAAELDDGIKTMPSWLRGHCRLSPAEAFRLVRRGRVLDQLPAVAAGFADGMITAEQVSVAAAVARPEQVFAAVAQDVDLTQIDAALAEVAMTRQYADLGKVVHHYLACLDPDGTEPDPTEGRRLSISTWSDCTVTGLFQLDALGGEKGGPRWSRSCRPTARRAMTGPGVSSWPTRSSSSPTSPWTSRSCRCIGAASRTWWSPSVPATFSTRRSGTARLGFGSWFSAQQARHLACDGDLTPITADEYGVPLNEGRTKRVVPPHIRRAVVLRDEHCIFAGCTAPHYWCDVHHLVHWAEGGETSVENSGLLCERQHTKVHHGFTIERDPTGRWHTYRPDGTEILLQPLLI